MSWNGVAVGLIVASALPATLLPVAYALSARFYRSWAGWSVMTTFVGLAAVIDASLLRHWLGEDYAHRDAFRVLAFGLVALGTWMFVGTFVRSQLLHRRERS